MTVSELYNSTKAALIPALGQSEAQSAARIIFEDVRGLTPTDIVLYGHRSVEDFTQKRVKEITDRIVAGMPVQYAVGTARFCGLDFKVTSDVLIPRPETEQLVDMICDTYSGKCDLRIIDCGTGSGCIAIALARALCFADIDAIDISDGALSLARENATDLKARINFMKKDILSLKPEPEPVYDIIVSNPPYITVSEEADMDRRVIDYEPHQALFVSDSDPLVFYRAIAAYGQSALKGGGRLYFEINPMFAARLRSTLADMKYTDIDIIRDYLGHNRFAVATLSRR